MRASGEARSGRRKVAGRVAARVRRVPVPMAWLSLHVMWALLGGWVVSPAQAGRTITVDPSIEYQRMEGFGTDLSWWAHRVGAWSEPARSEAAKLVFDPKDGLGFTAVRFHIGAGENPNCPAGDHLAPRAKIEGYKPSKAGAYDWAAAASQRWMLAHAIERYGITDVEANALSPPWWMTVSGCTAGAQTPGSPNLEEGSVDAYAAYLADVAQHFRDEWGVRFQSLSPFNEAEVAWWVAGGPQEGCCYSRPLMDGIITALGRELRDRGLSTIVCAPDTYAVRTGVESYRLLSEEARAEVAQISSHSYQGSLTDRYAFRDMVLAEAKPGVMTEVCHAGRPEGHTHTGMRCALEMAWQITTDVRDMGVSKWYLWTPVVDEFYNTNDVWNANDNWGPIHARFTGPEAERYWIAKEFHGLAHYTRFIRPGYVVVEADDPRVLAALDRTSGRLILVAYNEGQAPIDCAIGIAAGSAITEPTVAGYRTTASQSLAPLPPIPVRAGAFMDTLPAESITTYLMRVTRLGQPTRRRINDNVLGRGNGQFEYRGSWDYRCHETPVAYWMSVLDADYYEGWGAGPYSNDIHLSDVRGDYCLIRFEGTEIELYGPTGPEYGVAGISIDGGAESCVDCYSPSTRHRARVYSSGRLPQGSHVLKLRVTGDSGEQAKGSLVAVDEALLTTEG